VIDVDFVNEVSADYHSILVPRAAARGHVGVSVVDGDDSHTRCDRAVAQIWPVCAFHGPHGPTQEGEALSFCERCESAL
jgi:hypothetical protein